MPQLDKVTFLSQFFWLCIVFSSLYLALVKYYLPSLARIVLVRHSVLNSDSDNEGAQIQNPDSTQHAVSNWFSSRVIGNGEQAVKGMTATTLQSLQSVMALANQQSSKSFATDIAASQEEVLISEQIFASIAPPVNREINVNSDDQLIIYRFLNDTAIEKFCENEANCEDFMVPTETVLILETQADGIDGLSEATPIIPNEDDSDQDESIIDGYLDQLSNS